MTPKAAKKNLAKSNEHCPCCLRDIEPALDADLDGSTQPVCIQCRSEQEHDFDREPKARFNRAGRRIDAGARA
jgi:hypothetical protein